MVLVLQPSSLVDTHTFMHTCMHVRTGPLFCLRTITCPFLLLVCHACGQLAEWAVLIQPANRKWQLLVIG